MIKLDPAIKATFVAALRGDQYPQGKGMLRTDTGFCCLGVLCDLSVAAGIGEWSGEYFVTTDGERNSSVLPETVIRWATARDQGTPVTDDSFDDSYDGLYANPSVLVNDEEEGGWNPRWISLAQLNDRGHSFAVIADLVDEQL